MLIFSSNAASLLTAPGASGNASPTTLTSSTANFVPHTQSTSSTSPATIPSAAGASSNLVDLNEDVTASVLSSTSGSIATTINTYYSNDLLFSDEPSLIAEINLQFIFPPYERTASPAQWFRKPFFHMFLVRSQDSDNYKSTIKPKVKAFVDDMNEKEFDYVIVYVSEVTPTSAFKFPSFISVFDRMKADFKEK